MDHETFGAQEWQLPGYGRETSANLGSTSRGGASQSRAAASKSPIRSDSTSPQKMNGQVQQLLSGSGPLIRTATPSGRGAGRGTYRAKGRGSYTGRGQLNAAASRDSARLFKDSSAKSKWRSGLEPNSFVKLPTVFGSLRYDFFGAARATIASRKSPASQGRYEVFEDISQKTGAFVKAPSYTQQVIYIWGEATQVNSAKDILQRLISKCSSTWSSKKRLEWTKISAHSTTKEAGVELKERRETMLQQLRKAPESPSTLPEQLIFLWPKDGPPLSECLGTQLEALDVIRAKFGCHLFIPKELPDCICAFYQSHDVMRQIAHLLRTKWSELIANSNIKSKVLVVEPPAPISMREEIVVKNNNQLAKPFLHGNFPKDLELDQWIDRASLIESKNNARVLSAIEKALRGVAFVRGHLRMRVNIGSFVLEEYRRPKEDKSSYGFEEFREMLMHEQTKGRLIPGLRTSQAELLARCFKATDFLEPYESTTQTLESAEPAYSVNFEFLGSNNDLLRLEAEFAKCPGAHDYEVTQRRWLRPRSSGQASDKRSPLQISFVDFDRSDWQLEIKSLDFQEASSIDMALRSFSHSISFRRTENMGDISAAPKRKVIFPPSAPVSRFVEKSAIRYRLKGTKYTFEIARYDEYSRTVIPAFPGQIPTLIGPISEVPFTSWGASLFEPSWDNLLGQHANLPVGHSARYSPNLDTFFPPREQSTSTSDEKHTGFWAFIHLVKQAAEILSPAQTHPAQEHWKSTDKASPSPNSTLTTPDDQKRGANSDNSSPTVDAKGLGGMIDADLGTLF